MLKKIHKGYILLIYIALIALPSCITTQDFSNGLNKQLLKQGYIYQKASKTEQSSIKFHDDKSFTCDRTVYVPHYQGMEWGGGRYDATTEGLVLINKNCKLDPEFSTLKCVLKRKYGIGVQYIWYCQNEKAEEYVFWMIDK